MRLQGTLAGECPPLSAPPGGGGGGMARLWGSAFGDLGYSSDSNWSAGEHFRVWWNKSILDTDAWTAPSTHFQIELMGPTADSTVISGVCLGEGDGGHNYQNGNTAPVTFNGGDTALVLNPGDLVISDDIPLVVDPGFFQSLVVGVEFSGTSKVIRNSDHHDGSVFCVTYDSDGEKGPCENLTGIPTLTAYTALVTRIWVFF